MPLPEGVFLSPTDLLPPPMMEPAAREPSSIPSPALVGAAAPAPASASVSAPASAPASAAAPVTAPASSPAPLPLDLFPLESCAAIAARLALQPEDEPRILEAHQLDGATWNALHGHWQSAIRAALRSGDPSLLRAHDAAYVAEMERVCGAITLALLCHFRLHVHIGTSARTVAPHRAHIWGAASL